MTENTIGRRGLLQAAGAGALSLAANAAPSSRVVQENQKPGTTEWQLRHYRFDNGSGSGLRSTMLEGYVSDVSAYPGDKLDVMVSTAPAARFTLDIYRTGYYGGKGGRHMLRLGPFSGEEQPVPLMGMERIRECAWKPSAQISIPPDWPSGVYLGKLALVNQPVESYVIFVVKDRRTADLLFQCSDFTWQAYNKWPGWDSLYDTGITNRSNGYSYTGPNVRVSFDRPYSLYGQVHRVALSLGSGEFLLWEFPMSYWLEQQGYDVTYCANADVDRDSAVLRRCKVFLSVGHDEYWTRTMYENVMAARDRGISLGFFSGNAICRIIQPYDSTVTGKPLRGFARIKHFEDEEKLMGVKSFGPGYGDYVVRRADHWMFEGTGMHNGDFIQGLVGWEFHGAPANIPGLVEVASTQLGPYSKRPGLDNNGKHSSVIYPGPKSNWVFNAGTIWWPEGLSAPPGHAPAASEIARSSGPDARVQRITRNLLDRFLHDSTIKL